MATATATSRPPIRNVRVEPLSSLKELWATARPPSASAMASSTSALYATSFALISSTIAVSKAPVAA
jgi:hypothetical protein